MKYLLYLPLLLNLLIAEGAFACGNAYEKQTRPDGSTVLLYDDEGATSVADRHSWGFDTAALLGQKEALLLRLQQDSSYQALADLALLELKIGDRYKGVELLEKLYQQYPKEYNIVANLGTGYELLGKYELAYRFIKQALEIDPGSHQGSEWIHLNILEQKLNPSPDYTAIVQLGAGKSIREHYKTLGSDQIQALFPVKQQLLYQLAERMAFAPPQDAVVGQLLFDLADLVAMTESVERALPIWELSLAYDPALLLVNFRLEEAKEVPYVNPLLQYWPWLLSGIAFAAGLYYLLNRIGRRKHSRPEQATLA